MEGRLGLRAGSGEDGQGVAARLGSGFPLPRCRPLSFLERLASWLTASLPCPEDHKGLHGKPFGFLNESGDKADL